MKKNALIFGLFLISIFCFRLPIYADQTDKNGSKFHSNTEIISTQSNNIEENKDRSDSQPEINIERENNHHHHSHGCNHDHGHHHDHHHHDHHYGGCQHGHDHPDHSHHHHDHGHCEHSHGHCDDQHVHVREITGTQEVEKSIHHHSRIPLWLVLPFIILLAMIASGPVLYAEFWHKNYPKVALGLAGLVGGYYVFKLHDYHHPVESMFEYIQFIVLISSLFVASGGILIKIKGSSGPKVNTIVLVTGAVISNLIGTTGASMLLIRPFLRANSGRLRVYHIVFFIFIVSNVGGALTPIGDPPLFLGFLKGVPFFWTTKNNFFPWLLSIACLSSIFYFLDSKNSKGMNQNLSKGSGFEIKGASNFIWLGIIICSVFMDPNIFPQVPSLHFYGDHSFIREIIMVASAYFAYKRSSKDILKENQFSFDPLKEVVFIFIGIFGTMGPAMELVSEFAQSDAGRSLINKHTLYWGSGVLSSFLDNAPTYLNFLSASMGSHGADIGVVEQVRQYADGSMYSNSKIFLKAISVASVFFGAMTYIGNGPNFMVKSIAEENGLKMPSFFGYIIKYSFVFLFPVLCVIWIVFFLLGL